MNLLFDFIKNLSATERTPLDGIKLRGAINEVWLLIHKQAEKGAFDREEIQNTLGISSSHLDKITSELLVKTYQQMFGDNRLKRMEFLALRMAFVKHFYAELNRQLKYADKEITGKELENFYAHCMEMAYTNVPIAMRDEKAWIKVSAKYIDLFKGRGKANAKLLVACKHLLFQIDTLFAASRIKEVQPKFEKKIEALGALPDDANEDLVFNYYWTKMYFWHAIEQFAVCLELSTEALKSLKRFKSKTNDINTLRIWLKQSEMQYYLSMFDEAHANLERATNSPLIEHIRDRGYYNTKFMQLCLITGKLNGAAKILEEKRRFFGDKLDQSLAPRDIFSFLKYSLFAGNYDDAFKYLKLGFEKNPKGKYFQYEIELRNLQTAYFYLTGQTEQALEGCDKHIKYLRFHGYGLRQSDYPYFYVLTKAIFEKKTSGKELSKSEQAMMERYQKGSYAVYGRLLLRMMNV